MRTRIVAAITVTVAIGLLAVGTSVYLVERQSDLDQIDSRLAANLESARFIVAEGEAVSSDSTERAPWKSSRDALRAVVERMSPDDNTGVMGMLSDRISLVPGVALDVDLGGAQEFADHVSAQAAGGEPIIGTYAEHGVTWRYLAAPISVTADSGANSALFVMVYDIDAELSEFGETARVFLIASLITLIIVAAVGFIVATRLLRPLRQMRETATRVSAHALSERIPVVGRDDVADLARTMNAMLDRLDGALDSQRRLLSDVGHELKTPITIVHGHLEVMDAASETDVRETRTLVLDELDRMGRLVQDLGDAAALHGVTPVHRAPVDIADLLAQVYRKAQGITGAEVSLGRVTEGVALIDGTRIQQALLQLAQNAVSYGGGKVTLNNRFVGSDLELSVRDFGPGVPDELKETVFERFRRGPASDDIAGSGLGLNIVQLIARAHGGTVSVADAAGGGALFVIRLPKGEVSSYDRYRDVVAPPRPPLPTEKD